MKKHLFNLVAITSVLLSGCGNNQNGPLIGKNADIVYSESGSTVKVSLQSLGDLLNNNYDFLLYVGSETCPACRAFRPTLAQYLKESQTLMYEYDGTNYGYEGLFALYPAAFQDFYSTPSILLFEGGQIKHTFALEGSTSLKQLQSLIRDNTAELNHYYINSYSAFLSYQAIDPAQDIYELDASSPDLSNSYHELSTNNPDDKLFVINYAFMDEADALLIQENFN